MAKLINWAAVALSKESYHEQGNATQFVCDRSAVVRLVRFQSASRRLRGIASAARQHLGLESAQAADGTPKKDVPDMVTMDDGTVQFADTTVHAGHIRGFVYIRMVDGSQALLPVFALPGDTTDYGVTIDP